MHANLLRQTDHVTFDALRTGNMPALDNAGPYAEVLNNTPRAKQRSVSVTAAAHRTQPQQVPPPLLSAGDMVEVLWGDVYFVGTFTSSRSDRENGTRLYRIAYDGARAPGRRPGDVIERGSELDRAGHRNR